MEYFGKNENIFLHLRTVAILNGTTREGSRQLNTLYYSYTNNLMSFPPSHSAIQCVQQPLLQFQCYNFRTLRIRRVRQCGAACRRLVHSHSMRVWQGADRGAARKGVPQIGTWAGLLLLLLLLLPLLLSSARFNKHASKVVEPGGGRASGEHCWAGQRALG